MFANRHAVLVVDDNPALAQVLAFNLRVAGFSVDIAANGAEAVQKLTAGEFGTLITDVQMPTMDGIELCRVVREELGNTSIHILICSGKGLELDVAELRRRFQIHQLYFKPVSPREVVAAVCQVSACDSMTVQPLNQE